jgi:bifunctional oligoribonuclease and PAP phosphatase NrnA
LKKTTTTEIARLVQDAKNILVATHLNPEGDAIGSAVGLARSLTAQGKTVDMFNVDEIPPVLEFMVPAKGFIHHLEEEKQYDLVFIVDCNTPQRVGGDFNERTPDAPIVVLDHHVPERKLGELDIIDPAAPSACSVVLELIEELGWPLDERVAEALYTGLITDTGVFRFENAGARAFENAAHLVAAGAEPSRITRKMFDSYPRSRFDLMAIALATLTVSKAGKFAMIWLSLDDYRKAGADSGDSENFANYPRMIEGVEIAVFLREHSAGVTKASFRAGENGDVQKFAAQFSGGGHVKAAGASIALPLAKAREKILQALAEELKDEVVKS